MLQYPQPAGGATSRSYAGDVHFPRVRKQTSTSSTFVGKLLPSHKPFSLQPQQRPYVAFAKSPQDSGTSSPAQPTTVGANRFSDHGIVGKGARSVSSQGNLKNGYDQRSEPDFLRAKTPSITVRESPTDDSRSPSSRSVTRDKIKHNWKKLAQGREEEYRDTIDLSRTAAENEERSGLNIHTRISTARSATDVNFNRTPRARHGPLISHTSQQSTVSGSFQPTLPFVHPMRQKSRPYTPTTTQSYANSVISSDYSGDVFPGLAQDDVTNGHRHHSAQYSSSMASLPDRPPLYITTTGSATRLANPSQNNLSAATSFTTTRPRRSTNRSIDTTSPTSRSSVDRALNLIRRPTQDTEPVDPVVRAMNINAARQAFAAREEAKTRKYEKQEQKATDREMKKTAKEEDKRRRKSDAQERPTRDMTAEESDDYARAPHHAERTAVPESSLPTRRKTGGSYHPQDDLVIGRTINLGPSIEKTQPRISRQKEVTKNRYLRFLTWLKMRLLHLGKKRRKLH